MKELGGRKVFSMNFKMLPKSQGYEESHEPTSDGSRFPLNLAHEI